MEHDIGRTLEVGYDRTVCRLLGLREQNERVIGTRWRSRYWDVCDAYDLCGVFVEPTRLFLAGDVVLCRINNGQAERLRVSGYSFKKRADVLDLMQQYARWWFPESSGVKEKPAAMERLRKDPLADRQPGYPKSQQHDNRTRLRVFAPQGDSTGEGIALAQWALPAVRELALSGLRAACAAHPVRANSGANEGAG